MIKTRTKMLGNLSDDLARFEKAIQDKVLIAGAAGMAKVIYDEAREQAPIAEKAHFFYSRNFKVTGRKFLFQPGNLKAAIYRVYSPEKSTGGKQLYRITWNQKKAPYAFMVEYGTSQQGANSFMEPAFDRIQDAITAGKARMATVLLTLGTK